MRFLYASLLLVFGMILVSSFWSDGSYLVKLELQKKLDTLHQQVELTRERNAQISAQIDDLNDGLLVAEEIARKQGLIRSGEIFVVDGTILNADTTKVNHP